MLEAITTSKCQESFSLEGLELLGDAFLEVSVSERLFLLHNRMQEGELSKLRTSLICNTTLERLGRERGLMVSINHDSTLLISAFTVGFFKTCFVRSLDRDSKITKLAVKLFISTRYMKYNACSYRL